MTGRIAFQGEFGANSDTAARNVYPDMEPLPCGTFEEAFEALRDGSAELAMIPIENTLAGRVADIHALMPESGFHIVGEYFLPIHFHLMARPGVKIADLATVYSHVHALGQCRTAIRDNRWTPVITDDTAGAARMVSQMERTNVAALAPELAADLYGLEILQRHVEDADHNTTRFVVLAREADWAANDGAPTVTTFMFRVRNVPAALYKVMGGFATNGINMTKLESYQIGGAFTATLFYADIEGHPDDPAVARALEEMSFFCAESRILGVYPAHPFRDSAAIDTRDADA